MRTCEGRGSVCVQRASKHDVCAFTACQGYIKRYCVWAQGASKQLQQASMCRQCEQECECYCHRRERSEDSLKHEAQHGHSGDSCSKDSAGGGDDSAVRTRARATYVFPGVRWTGLIVRGGAAHSAIHALFSHTMRAFKVLRIQVTA